MDRYGPGAFALHYSTAEFATDDAQRGTATSSASPSDPLHAEDRLVLRDAVTATSDFSNFPAFPNNFHATPEVNLMYARYTNVAQGRETLPSVAYFCLTIVQKRLPHGMRGRQAAANYYQIDPAVLRTIGELTSAKGGTEARKADGAQAPLSAKESVWLCHALRILINRVAEKAGAPDASLRKLTMAHLPNL